jgi:hypothetical protein
MVVTTIVADHTPLSTCVGVSVFDCGLPAHVLVPLDVCVCLSVYACRPTSSLWGV